MSASGPVRACPACAHPGPHPTHAVPGKRAIGGGPLLLASCTGCDALFQPSTPAPEELARWYDYMGHDPHNITVSPLVARRIARIVGKFDDSRQTGRLIEVGCGGGVFVRAAMTAGWEMWGTEISASCVETLRPLLGARLHQGSVVDAPFPAGSFDGAVLIEVIEHLADPDSYLEAIRRLLRPGGRLLLTTPNAHGSASRVLGHRWHAIGEEHLNYFGRRSLSRLLERHGFGSLRVASSNLDLLALAVQHGRRRLGASSSAPATPTAAAPGMEGATVGAAALPRPSRGAELRAQAADLAIEVLNRFASASRLGDTLRVVAHRTS